MPDPLSALARLYGSDKWSAKHSYTKFYNDMFAARRLSVRKVVEIGVGEGASVRMWRDYFPNAQIYGAEIDPARCFTSERIDVLRCDQANLWDLRQLIEHTGTDVDLFIDDGSHRPIDQMSTCLLLMALLAKGVTYVIEDAAPALNLAALSGYNWDAPKLEYRRRYDNRLIVVRH